MASLPKRVCWDACTWIALIQDEKILDPSGRLIEDRGTACKAVIAEAKKGKIEIVTSALNLVEVCKDPKVRNGDLQRIADFMEQDYVLLVAVDRYVGEFARSLMMSDLRGLKPPDATHLATACVAPNVDELHTFDDKLLRLDGRVTKVDQSLLKICKPDVGKPAGPLLKGMTGG